MEEIISGSSAIGDLAYLQRAYSVNEDDREGIRALYLGSPSAGGSDHDVAAQSYWVPDDQVVAAANGDCGNHLGARARPSPHTDILALALEEDPLATYGQCTGGGSFSVHLPRDGDGSAPTNSRIVWLAFERDGAGELAERVTVDTVPPVDVGWTVDDRTVAGGGAVILTFDEDLPPGTAVTVRDPLTADYVWVAFTTGDAPDEEPPELGGYQVETIVRPNSSCAPTNGPWTSHVFRLDGLADDVTAADDLVVHLAPRGVGRDVWNSGSTAFVGHTLCGGDPTLASDRHRRYDIEIYDGAWNGGVMKTVSTRGSLGCSTRADPCREWRACCSCG